MRVVFAGTPAFAVPALEALVRAGHEVALVLTDWGSGWPVTEGERLAARVGGRVPLVIVAAAADDAEVLQQRIGGPTVQIVTDAPLTAVMLADVIRAAVARARGVAGAAAPS